MCIGEGDIEESDAEQSSIEENDREKSDTEERDAFMSESKRNVETKRFEHKLKRKLGLSILLA